MRTTTIKKGRWQAALVKHFNSNHNRVLLLMLATSITSGAAVAVLILVAVRLIGGPQ